MVSHLLIHSVSPDRHSTVRILSLVFILLSGFPGTAKAAGFGEPPEVLQPEPREEERTPAIPVPSKTEMHDSAKEKEKSGEDRLTSDALPEESFEGKSPESLGVAVEDSQRTEQRFAAGMEALQNGQFERAIRIFQEVETEAVMPELREAARAMVAYTSRLDSVVKTDPDKAEALTSGRVEFIVTSTLIGAYAGGVLLDWVDNDSFQLGVGAILLTTSGALVGSLYGTRGAGITAAQGGAYTLGSLWGGTSALLLMLAARTESSEWIQTGLLTGVAGGAVGSFFLSRSLGSTAGQVSLTGNGGTLGLFGALLALPLVPYSWIDESVVPMVLFAGLQAGTLGGALGSMGASWSAARARLTLLGGGLGALALWGTVAVVGGVEGNPDVLPRIWAGSALAGLFGGYFLTAWLTRDMAPDVEFLEEYSWQWVPLVGQDFAGLGLAGTF